MSQEKHHISSYASHLVVLGVLLVLTALSVAVTQLEMGPANTIVALIIAGAKATTVLIWFMHLKFDDRLYTFFTLAVFLLFVLVIIVTFFDYSYR